MTLFRPIFETFTQSQHEGLKVDTESENLFVLGSTGAGWGAESQTVRAHEQKRADIRMGSSDR
jgi:hypothetical protein